MKRSEILLGIVLITLLTLLTGACKKSKNDENPPPAAEGSWATDNALAENIYDNVKDWSDLAMANTGPKSTQEDTVYMGTCVLATLDMNVSPYKLTIDFGSTNCKCDDNKWRRGKIICTFTGNYFAAGTVINYTFENYFVNDNQVLGTKTVTNKGRNTANHLNWEIQVDGQIIKAGNGGAITWNSTRQLEWTEGETTPFAWWDDVYLLTGNAHGSNPYGKTFVCTITKALKKKLNCEWITSGTIEIQPQDFYLIVMDYGDGNCNDQATVVINGQTYTITMP